VGAAHEILPFSDLNRGRAPPQSHPHRHRHRRWPLPGPPEPRLRQRHHHAALRTADSTTSASADDTPANACWSSSATSTSASSRKTATSSATSPSTPPATTNPRPKRERCRETSVHDVPRRHSRAAGTRTWGLPLRRPSPIVHCVHWSPLGWFPVGGIVHRASPCPSIVLDHCTCSCNLRSDIDQLAGARSADLAPSSIRPASLPRPGSNGRSIL
jgi:hypothetical protein